MFDVSGVNFHNAADGSIVRGLCNTVDFVTLEAGVVFYSNGLYRAMLYTDFFRTVETEDGERPAFMPLDEDNVPISFNTGDRYWDIEVDAGLVV